MKLEGSLILKIFINMMMIRKGLDALNLDVFKEISLPVLLKTLEEDNY